LPSNASNVLSVFNNGISNPIDSTRTWFRWSSVAPKNVWVRAIESEPMLYEIPSTRNPADARFQVTYNIRFKDYVSIDNTQTSSYMVNTIPSSTYFE
jgi:hypothetical protein